MTPLDVHVVRLVRSFQRLTGRALLPPTVAPEALTAAARNAPFALLSHGTESDPLLNYANTAAIAVFMLEDGDIGSMATRLTAAPQDQAARAALLADVAARGFTDTYSGPRVSRDGRRFDICNATVWTVSALEDGGTGLVCGQAAMFASWTPLSGNSPPPPLVTHVRMRCAPQHAALVRTLTLDNARHSLREPGCLRFEVLQSREDPGLFTLVEQFSDANAVAAHKLTPHYLRWRDAVAPLMAEPRSATAFETI